MTLTINTYKGYSEKSKNVWPITNTFPLPIIARDSFEAEFFSEMSEDTVLVPELINKMYFRVKSLKKDNDEKTEPVEFDRAELFEGETVIPLVGNITHIFNGYGYFEFVPKDYQY